MFTLILHIAAGFAPHGFTARVFMMLVSPLKSRHYLRIYVFIGDGTCFRLDETCNASHCNEMISLRKLKLVDQRSNVQRRRLSAVVLFGLTQGRVPGVILCRLVLWVAWAQSWRRYYSSFHAIQGPHWNEFQWETRKQGDCLQPKVKMLIQSVYIYIYI